MGLRSVQDGGDDDDRTRFGGLVIGPGLVRTYGRIYRKNEDRFQIIVLMSLW